MNQNLQWWLTLLLMGGVTFLLRAAPLLLPKSWLKSQLLQDTNAALPLVVLMLLIISGLSLPAAGGSSDFVRLAAEAAALTAVLFVHARWRNMLLSMVAGVAALNGLLWLLGV